MPAGTERPRTAKAADRIEWLKCRRSLAYFVDTYCLLLSGDEADAGARWIPFRLRPAQENVCQVLQARKLVVCLKARQIGLTWLAVAFVLWLVLFYPACTALLFSRRDVEAQKLLTRLKGMYARLPEWMQARGPLLADSGHDWKLPTESEVMAFPTNAGDSYTAQVAVGDEFDLIPPAGQESLLAAVKPTLEGGGRLILLSRPDKSRPNSPFKRIYRAARSGENGWTPVFLPWHSHPARNRRWYEATKREILARTGSDDELHEQYPETEGQALAGRTLDKRLPAAWLGAVYAELRPVAGPDAPPLSQLRVYRRPAAGHVYVIGADTAEGNPTSDDSAAEVLDAATGEQAATFCGRMEPKTFARGIGLLAAYYNHAPALVERNNHGHAVILCLELEYPRTYLLKGQDGRTGWQTSALSKASAYDKAADQVREGQVLIHDPDTYEQLAGIEGSTLKAPPGDKDDRAIAFVLACVGREQRAPTTVPDDTVDGRTEASRAPPEAWG